MAPDGKYEPIRFQIWVLTLVWVMPAIWGFVRFLPPFPLSDPATATHWIPKLASDASCLPAYIGQAATDRYVVQYANTVFWLGLLGFGLGASVFVALGQAALLKRSAIVDPAQTALAATAGNSSLPTDKWSVLRDRILRAGKLIFRAGRLAWVCSVLIGLALVLPWWWGFLDNACGRLKDGYPIYRVFDGLLPATMSGFLFFSIGIVVAIVFGLVTGGFTLYEVGKDSSPPAGPNG